MMHNRNFKVMVFVFILGSSFLHAVKTGKGICVEDLYIFNILNNAKVFLAEDLLNRQTGSSSMNAGTPCTADTVTTCTGATNKSAGDMPEKKLFVLVEQEINLLHEIVNGFNKGLLVFVEYKFVSMCNFFKNSDEITPKDIRAFKRKVIKFDDFVKKFCSKKKSLLEANELALCEKIIKFDQILLKSFLRHDFYDIDLFDEIADLCFFRPVEWMGEHPLITVAAASVIFYFFIWPHINLKFWDEEKKDGYVLIKNRNQGGIEVVQIKQQVTQSGLTCGAHAVFNLIAMFRGNGDPKAIYDFVNDQADRTAAFARWTEIVNQRDVGNGYHPRGLSSLNGGGIQAILTDIRDNGIPTKSGNAVVNFPRVNLIDDSNMLTAEGFGIVIEDASLFIVNTAQSPTSENSENIELQDASKSYGHWLPFMLRARGDKGTDATVFTVDSSWNTNRTNGWHVRRLHDIWITGS